MRFLLRILGTWALGFALILVVKDITISLSTMSISFSSFAQTWQDLHAPSFIYVSQNILNWFASFSAQNFAQLFFDSPAWIILSFFGVLLLFLGRKKKIKSFVKSGWR